jgi:hypothetical protein
MQRVYEIFEVLPNGSPHRVATITGLEFVKLAVERLAKRTKNECFATDARTRQVVMQTNTPPAKLLSTKRIFQIAYDEQTDVRRAELLRSCGYGVISVIGNEAAKLLLRSIQRYDLFIVGHAAPEGTRSEIVGWLKATYPSVKILALNPPSQSVFGADYNVLQNGPETWLPIIFHQFANSAHSPAPNKASGNGT